MDVIAAHQAKFENVVASMGTSLTEQQVRLLKRLTKRLALALDADSAGIQATLRGIEVVDNTSERVVPVPTGKKVDYKTTADVELSIIVIPPDKDPDDIIREDPASWQRLTDSAISVMDFVWRAANSQTDLNTPQGKAHLLNQVRPTIAKMVDPIRKLEYVERLSELVGMPTSILWDLVGEQKANAGRRKRAEDAGFPDKTVSPSYFSNPVEEYCLALVMQNPNLKPQCSDMSSEYLESSSSRELFLRWLQTPDVTTLKEVLDPALSDLLDRLLSKPLPPANPAQREYELADCIAKLRERWLRNLETQKELLLIQEAESTEDEDHIAMLERGADVPQRLQELFHEPRGKQRLRNKHDD
jgi:DNA primase